MTESDVKTGGPDPIASNVYDDDDLIDYDDDVLEPTEAYTATKPEKLEAHPNVTDHESPSETIAGNSILSTKPTDFDQGLNIPNNAAVGERSTATEPANGMDEISYDEEKTGGDENGLSAPEHNDQPSHEGKGDPTQNQDQDDEEIDFGIVEHNTTNGAATTENQQAHATAAMEGDDLNSEEHIDDAGGADEGNAHAAVETSESANMNADNAQTDQSHNLSQPQADAAENDEITWEEDPEDQAVSRDNASHSDQLTPGNVDAAENASQMAAAQPFVAGGQIELGDHAYEEANNADEHEFPAVTVQYKGEEFPLFSITAEGFFTSTSVLEQNIGSLLAGFREELANELASEDELVFQVDELGLEYAESHSQDTLGHVTLNQILEIFDLLAKNQDPDSERALYTYLFTKPSTSKRFESLIESAAAGTGLDQVIYHFDSPVPHGTNPEGGHVASSHHNLDEYQSPSDVSAGTHDEITQDQQEYDYIDDLDDTQANASAPNVGHGGLQAPGESLPESGEDSLAATRPQPAAEAEANGNTTQFFCQPFTSFNSSAIFNSTSAYHYPRAYNPSGISDFDMTLSQKDADENLPAFTEADFEMAMVPDVDNVAGDDDCYVNGDLTNEYQNDALDLTNAGTSASNTIDNDDTGLDMTAEEAAEALDQFDENKAPDQIDDEIDWREDPTEEDISTMSAGAIKRSHNTDGLDQEDGPEPKRQRS